MNIFVTYANEKYAPARHLCAKMAKVAGGFDKVLEFGPEDVDDRFRQANAQSFGHERGAGLWVWKPYIIYKVLKEVAQEGDVVFYADAGTFFIRSFKHILRTMDKDVWVSNIPLAEKQYTKREVFVRMHCEGPMYEETPQMQATFMGVRKTTQGLAFMEEWLNYVCDYELLSPESSRDYPEKDCYLAHREDQSILSLLCKKHGIKPHLDPTQYANYPEKYLRSYNIRIDNPHTKEYPVSILLHRRGNIDVRRIFFQYLHVVLPKCMVKPFLSKEYYR